MAAITAQSVLNVFFMLTIFYLAYEVHYQQVANNEGKNIIVTIHSDGFRTE